jgi:hypothetical protein
MTRAEVLAQLALAGDYAAAHPGRPFEAERALDWAVASGRIPPFANPLARALTAEAMREALERGRFRVDADGTVIEPDVGAAEGLGTGQPPPPPGAGGD